MIFSPLIFLLGAVNASHLVRSADQCNADNCARAAAGTVGGLQSERLASCSSFQACTVTPPATTVFVTSTATVHQPTRSITATVTTVTRVQVVNSTVLVFVDRDAIGPSARATNCPTAIPATASPCSGTSRYASACSCAGVMKSYTTIKARTITDTVTITRTQPPVTKTVKATAYTNVTSVAVTTVTPPASTGFALQLDGAHPYSGQYLYLFRGGRGDPGPLPVAASPMLDSETGTFTLDNQTHLNDYGFIGALDGRQGSSIFKFIEPPYPAGYTLTGCQVLNLGTSKSLYCFSGDRTAFYICAPGRLGSGLPTVPLLQLGNSSNIDGCYFTAVKVVRSQF